MNLAELRKKAQQEKKEEMACPVAPPEMFAQLDEVLALPVEASPDEDLIVPFVMEEHEEEPDFLSVTVRQEPSKTFDPVAVILAGRKTASGDETLSGSEETGGASSEEFQEFLCFRVSSEIYAINIMEIKEIIKPREVTEVPRAPDFVSGVLSLRGIIIPIFNMRLRLGLAGNERSAKERIIVLKKRDEFFGILVDEVIQVVRIAAATIEKPPAVLDGIDRDFVNGIGRFDGQMLILLNQEKILDLTLG